MMQVLIGTASSRMMERCFRIDVHDRDSAPATRRAGAEYTRST
jgi:hypothetical protein